MAYRTTIEDTTISTEWTPRYRHPGTAYIRISAGQDGEQCRIAWQYQVQDEDLNGSGTLFYEDSRWRDSDFCGPYITEDGIDDAFDVAGALSGDSGRCGVLLGPAVQRDEAAYARALSADADIPVQVSDTGTKVALAGATPDDIYTAVRAVDDDRATALEQERAVEQAVTALEQEVEHSLSLPRWMR